MSIRAMEMRHALDVLWLFVVTVLNRREGFKEINIDRLKTQGAGKAVSIWG